MMPSSDSVFLFRCDRRSPNRAKPCQHCAAVESEGRMFSTARAKCVLSPRTARVAKRSVRPTRETLRSRSAPMSPAYLPASGGASAEREVSRQTQRAQLNRSLVLRATPQPHRAQAVVFPTQYFSSLVFSKNCFPQFTNSPASRRPRVRPSSASIRPDIAQAWAEERLFRICFYSIFRQIDSW